MREAKRLMRALGDVRDRYVEEAAPHRNNVRRLSVRKVVCLVACLVLMLSLSVIAYAANWFGIRDLFIPDPEEKYQLISLSGYQGSPEAEAHREWNEFLATYDADHKILESLGNGIFQVEGREDWSSYPIYSYEMGEKLDEIVSRHGLKLHTKMDLIDQEELMYRVGGNFMNRELLTWAYMYEDGYFHVEGDVRLSGVGTVAFQFIRSVKGTFNEVGLNIDDVEMYTEWQYITSCGEPVLLAIAPKKALIFADYEKCFITVNVLCGSNGGMTEKGLQELADQIDFGILKEVQTPDMRGDSVVPGQQETFVETPVEEPSETPVEEPSETVMEDTPAPGQEVTDSTLNEIYMDAVWRLAEENVFPNGLAADPYETERVDPCNSYQIMDVDGDGREELLINYPNAYAMAGMSYYIFEYDMERQEFHQELAEFPAVAIYDNGIIIAQASHNHGRSSLDDFWPYSVYQYQKDTDTYELLTRVDAWQYILFEGAQPDPDFPKEADVDGDGILYYLPDLETFEPTNIMDNVAYAQWAIGLTATANQIHVDYEPLPKKNDN